MSSKAVLTANYSCGPYVEAFEEYVLEHSILPPL
jgi:hypothetical protein